VISRIYALFFVAIIIAGAFYQRQYMRTSTAEIKALEERLRRDNDLLSTKDFVLDRFANARRVDRISAGNGRVTTDGTLNLDTNLWIIHFNEDSTHSKVHSNLASGKLILPSKDSPSVATVEPEGTESENPRERGATGGSLETLRFPEEVTAYMPEGVVRTNDVLLDFGTHLLTTDQVVTYRGQGKSLRGKGMSFNIEDGEFELRGPVTGELEPVRTKPKGRL
jgi:lipopolysaccharide export system protein LptC